MGAIWKWFYNLKTSCKLPFAYMTAAIKTEAANRLAVGELEKRVVERTAELAETVEILRKEIAERKKTEEALRQSEERYALAVLGSNDGIWDWNLETDAVYLSPRWKSMLGYRDDEIGNNHEEWKNRIHPEDYPRAKDILSDYLEGRISHYEFESRILHKDGNYRWIFNRGICLRDKEGKPCRIAGSHTDITVRKRAEEELRKNEELLRIILETLPVGVAVFDRKGKKILENRALRKIWGYTEETGIAIDDCKGWHVDSGERIRKEEWPTYRAFSKGIAEKRIVEIECFDGTKRTVILSAAPLKIGDQIIAGVSVVEDISEQRSLEQQLLQAQKMESIGLLAGGVAHEFNNLLTAISGCCEELMEELGEQDKHCRPNIKIIQSAAREAAELTRNLLAFSRKQVINLQPLAVNDIVTNTGKLLAQTLEEYIHFSADLSHEKLTIMGDSGQIKQVLINLAINARDAMPAGGYLKFKTWHTFLDEREYRKYELEKPGGYVVVSVSDTGSGMDEKTLEKIFEPFFTTKEIGKGTGLGLSIIYGIIKQHSGAVAVESTPGEGTTFTIYLPLAEAETSQEKLLERNLSAGGTETILVVEDEEFVRHFLEKTLGRAGYRVIVAEDGEKAVTKFQDHGHSVSLVISDMVMPKKSGREMYEDIQRINPDIKVLFISGYSRDIIEGNGVLGENVDFIAKPFTRKDLLDKTRSILA
ncbi:MAG: domain S-box [Geobacteraceae bacterium]|nr:domain S-box [Geobacteraceae bacterium]